MSLLAAATAAALLSRMQAVNSDVHSLSAQLNAHVVMRSFPYLSADLTGTYYYKEPDKNKVVFTGGVPVIAQQFDRLYARIENPSQWERLNTVTLVSDDGKTAHFKLVPRKHGNVDSIDATVDDKSATVTSMRWNYGNGGYAEMTNYYTTVDGRPLVVSQTGHVQEPGYTGDITSTLEHYKINPPLADSLFVDQ
jgi:outer membrane lipoprotein-sorting protein